MQNAALKRREIFVLLTGFLIGVTGCSGAGNTGTVNRNSNSRISSSISASQTGSSADTLFPKHIDQKVSDVLNIDADVGFPDKAENGRMETAKMEDATLWSMRNSIRKTLIPDDELGESEISEDGSDPQQWELYCTSSDQEKLLNLQGSGTMTYTAEGDDPTHVSNALNTDVGSSDYNGNLYQKQERLSFGTKEDAWNKAKDFMKSLGITQVSDEYQCYVMDYQTMAAQEKAIADQVEKDLGKKTELKSDWSEEDDCYYFQSRQEWNGCPVLPAFQGEGTDFYNITVIVDQTGIIELQLMEYHPLQEDGRETDVVSPNKIVIALKKYRNNLLLEDTWTVERIELGFKVSGEGNGRNQGGLIPVWNCSVKVSSAESESTSDTATDSYMQYISFYADSGKVVPA